ncbi:hypothetical protein GF323_06210 [Candidatus Woesearchaeota archaeon]|nr:hypothetical protein [Candidatus Woesearchaeota archaeon]
MKLRKTIATGLAALVIVMSAGCSRKEKYAADYGGYFGYGASIVTKIEGNNVSERQFLFMKEPMKNFRK